MVSSVLAPLASRLLVSLAAGAAACAAAGAAAAPALPATCRAPLVAGSPATAPAAQVITVAASPADRTRASVRLWERRGPCWASVAGAWPARLGYNGVSVRHREGDGTTPSGTFGIGPVMYGTGPDPGVRFRYHRLACGDWWDEDPVSPTYNSFQHVACGTTPAFRAGSEALWRATDVYSTLAVVRYNDDPVVRGAGSAIFLHADNGLATTGCVSLPRRDLLVLLRRLRPSARPLVVIGTRSRIGSLGLLQG